MRNVDKYKGIFPAFYACYDDEGNVSAERTETYVQYLIDKGVQGLYVNGSSGECIYLSVEERKLVLESVMKVARGKLVIIAHVACNNTKDSVELAKHAESLGVDAIAAIPPIYFRLPDYAIADYWNTISAGAPNTDFVIYNIPQLAGVNLTVNLFKEMRKNPRVVGVKNSSMPIQDIQMFKAAGGDDCVIFNGPDEQFVGGRSIGAAAGIGGTYGAMPELFVAMDQAVANCQMQRALNIQNRVNEIIFAFFECKANMYAVIKEIHRLNGMPLGSVREPLYSVKDEDREKIQKIREMIASAIADLDTY